MMRYFAILSVAVILGANFSALAGGADRSAAADRYREKVQPILEQYCYGCHGYGSSEGGRTLDEFASDDAMLADTELWWAVLKNVRSRMMPPAGEEQPTSAERDELFRWIQADAFGIDPADLDPGHVTLRRLNRAEYRNTIRSLMGVDYDTEVNFPPDDSGYGFDNIGDALSLSPLLMEKYFQAAETIVAQSVPTAPKAASGAAPKNYARLFPAGPAPPSGSERDAYARKVLKRFATRAFRRPVDDASINKLVALAKNVYEQPGQSFEEGVGRAMVAVLSSPRFLFRVEEPGPTPPGKIFPLVDEYSLASRLSYFLWTTMPDDELMRLADRGQLRAQLDAQLTRMLADRRSAAFVRDFTGQWLQARDVETIAVDPVAALGHQQELETLVDQFRALHARTHREPHRAAELAEARKELDEFRAIHAIFNGDIRYAMRRETEMTFEYVMREDRNLVELIDADYTFLNEKLAEHYGIPGVAGNEMRRVALPPDSPRGGVLTQGTALVVTSNPTRTSPVKRGLFVLDNILGTPVPPPPEAVPPLEAAADAISDHQPSLREALEVHRKDPLCAGCHARMDPLGLALENFNALGMWRDTEHDRPIDTAGTLLTGEQFQTIVDLKKVLAEEHKLDFYRCLTEKLLTYATGRGLEYYDEPTVDAIVRQLEEAEGRFSVLLRGIVESAPFQRQRAAEPPDADQQARHDRSPVR